MQDFGVDDTVGGELRARLAGRAFEGELWEEAGWGVGGEGAVEGFAGGGEDGGDYLVAGLGEVLLSHLLVPFLGGRCNWKCGFAVGKFR